jgi:hypothetical protein
MGIMLLILLIIMLYFQCNKKDTATVLRIYNIYFLEAGLCPGYFVRVNFSETKIENGKAT